MFRRINTALNIVKNFRWGNDKSFVDLKSLILFLYVSANLITLEKSFESIKSNSISLMFCFTSLAESVPDKLNSRKRSLLTLTSYFSFVRTMKYNL